MFDLPTITFYIIELSEVENGKDKVKKFINGCGESLVTKAEWQLLHDYIQSVVLSGNTKLGWILELIKNKAKQK